MRQSKPTRFSQFLAWTLIVFEVVTLAFVVGVLYGILSRSMTQEYENRIRVEQAKVASLLREHFNAIEGKLRELSFNNTLRVNLMLEMDEPLVERIRSQYPASNGVYFYIKTPTGKRLPTPPTDVVPFEAAIRFVNGDAVRNERYFLSDTSHRFWCLFSAKMKRQNAELGTAYALYDIAQDKVLWETLFANRDMVLAISDEDSVRDLRTGERLFRVDKTNETTEIAAGQIWPIESIPGLFYIASMEPLHEQKDALVRRLVFVCLIVLVLTVLVAAYLARKVSTPLVLLAEQTAAIARAPAEGSLNISGIQHAEFRMLGVAFNDVLVSLRETESRFRRMLDDVPNIAIQGYDADGVVHYWNQANESIYGYAPEEAIGKNLVDLIIPAEMREAVRAAIRQGAQTGTMLPASEMELMRKDGSRVPVFSSHVVVRHRNRPPEMYCIDIDLRDRKRLEGELRQSEKMQAIGQLAGGIAHDFNNQLGSIMGFSDLLRDQLQGQPELYEFADMILQSSKRSSELTKQLLAFARKGNIESVPVDLHNILREVITLLQHSLDKQIHVHKQLLAPSAVVVGDPSQLQNAFLNMGINARDAMSDGGKLLFETERVFLSVDEARAMNPPVESGYYIRICISDTGSGIDVQTQEHIFEPFFTTKAKGKGTGMGLAAVYGTVSSHAGAIAVSSSLGVGTTFSVFFPAVIDVKEALVSDELKSFTTVYEKKRILVVDDEVLMRRMSESVLKRFGCVVETCSNGREAVEHFDKTSDAFDLVLLDLVMPEMDGHDAFLAMRAIRPFQRVVFCSGYSPKEKNRTLIETHQIPFLQKPFTALDLKKILDVVFENKG